MAHLDYDFTANDDGCKVQVVFINKATGKRLTPFNGVYNAVLLVKPQDGATTQRTMSVLAGANDGVAEYQFNASDLVEGDLEVQARAILVSNGDIVTELGTKIFKVGPLLS